ncbi:hypothetical protein ACHAXR_003123, partial [Thalassiosira sp. AJA248-18]
MLALPHLALFQVALLMASWAPLSPVAAFAPGFQTQQRQATVAIRSLDHAIVVGRRSRLLFHLGAKTGDDDDEEEDPLLNDQREGMADAFAGLDGLTADDFDDLRPLSSSSSADSSSAIINPNMEGSAQQFMEMQAELSARGEDGLYNDILGDLSGDIAAVDAPTSYLNTEEQDVTGLGQALDETAGVIYDADGLGTVDPSTNDPSLTTADVSNDILTQDIQPSLSMEDFMSSTLQEAVEEMGVAQELSSSSEIGRTDDIAMTTQELLENEELRKGIEEIFDRAGDKLRLEVEAMKREQ